jgi:hypothetical protein
MARFVAGVADRFFTGKALQRLLRAHIVAAMCLTLMLSLFYYRSVGYEAVKYFGANLAVRWAELGRWLERNTAPGDSIATPVIGAIGYYSNRTVIDMVGLTDATITHDGSVAPHARKDHRRFNTEYVLAREPAFIYLVCEFPEERAFLQASHWIPAVQDMKRFLPNEEYRYGLMHGKLHSYALYRRRRR